MIAGTLPRNGRGFTLLEVMVAVAILGLGLTTILSSQVGLFSSSSHAAQLSMATGLVRCKMSEIETDLLRDGYPLLDLTDSGVCCEDSEQPGFTCDWRVEAIELPNPPDTDVLAENDEESEGGGGGMLDQAGALGALAEIEQSEGAVLGGEADLGSISNLMGGAAMGGVGSMAPLVMGIVYPELKGMLEASIRKITVRATWKEGKIERELQVVQYVTNPTQGGIEAEAADGLTDAVQAITGEAAEGSEEGAK